jgi:hypothetical protein
MPDGGGRSNLFSVESGSQATVTQHVIKAMTAEIYKNNKTKKKWLTNKKKGRTSNGHQKTYRARSYFLKNNKFGAC